MKDSRGYLTDSFLSPYRTKGDPFPNLIARSTFLSKYSRDGQSWTDTARRVVEGNCALDPNVTVAEAEALFDTIWNMRGLPPGRGLWTGGVPGMPISALYNCHAAAIRSTDDWRWCALMLMCGGGVGLSLAEIDRLPVIAAGNPRLFIVCSKSHPDLGDVNPDEFVGHYDREIIVPDSREGWVDTFKEVLDAAFEGTSLLINVSSVRPYGAPLKTFGGHASGPGALVTLLRNAWAIVRHRSAGRLTSVDCLDITNHTGIAIRAGGARRSALIVLGKADDLEFRRAKHDWDAVISHRSSSNNSNIFDHEAQFASTDWAQVVDDMENYGEPGLVNLWLARQTDPEAIGVNPCGEIILHQREACCLSEVFPSIAGDDMERSLKLMTRYTLRQRLTPMEDADADRVRVRNMRLGVGLGGICDVPGLTDESLKAWYRIVRNEANAYADSLGVNRPNFVTTVKPSGTISLLNGSSPGIHAPYAPYYIRRTRISELEPMAAALKAAGVPHEPCVYDKTGRTLVFSFPMRAIASSYATNQTVTEQIQRLVRVQAAWADNAVSTTVNFSETEKLELTNLLREYVPRLIKSVSCLPKKHAYEQAPYEQIDETKYRELMAIVDNGHPLTFGGEIEIDECAGGACPIK